jgi:hypothetical protein
MMKILFFATVLKKLQQVFNKPQAFASPVLRSRIHPISGKIKMRKTLKNRAAPIKLGRISSESPHREQFEQKTHFLCLRYVPHEN